MPVRSMPVPGKNPTDQDLTDRLIAEWRNPDSSAQEPLIVVQGGPHDRPTRVFVVWQEWANLNQQQRSAIIMDAAEFVLGQQGSFEITIAMGLTREEAQQMNYAEMLGID